MTAFSMQQLQRPNDTLLTRPAARALLSSLGGIPETHPGTRARCASIGIAPSPSSRRASHNEARPGQLPNVLISGSVLSRLKQRRQPG